MRDASIDLTGVEKIILTAPHGHVHLVAAPNKPTLLLHAKKTLSEKDPVVSNFDQWDYTLTREGSIVRIEAGLSQSKAQWIESEKLAKPEYFFEISGPPVAFEVALQKGTFAANGWNKGITALVLDGSVKLQGGSGDVRLQVNQGEVHVDGYQGHLDLHNLSARATVNEFEGDIAYQSLGGDALISHLKGNLRATARTGNTTVSKMNGSLDFDIGRGNLNIAAFEGSLRGSADDGTVTAALEGEPDVNLDTVSGSVSIKCPPGSGAIVKAQTEDGTLLMPEGIKPAKQGTLKIASGKMPGTGKSGSVILKTQKGQLRVH